MAQVVIPSFDGLTTDNQNTTKPGALAVAQNVLFDARGSVRPRNALIQHESFGAAMTSIFPFTANGNNTNVIGHGGTALKTKSSSAAATWSTITGTFTIPTGATAVRAVEHKSNLYLTTAEGVRRYDATLGALSAGAPTPLDMTLTQTNATTGTATAAANMYAYRVVLGYRDTNNNVILSAPSQRQVYPPTGTTATADNVTVRAYIPSTVTSSSPQYFYQVYRSLGSGGITTEPSDEMGLVYEANVSSTDVSNKYVEFVDKCPDAFLGPTGYFCASQDGILQANHQPPIALDIDLYNDHTFVANTVSKHRMYLSILSTDTSTGIRVDDTLVIAGTTYTWKGTENVGSAQPKVFTAGSFSQNIEDTAKSLVRVINGYSSNTSVYAYYVSGYQETPGKILIEARTLGASSFAATASANASAYNPPLPTSGTTVSSKNDTWQNAVWWSKKGLPDAFPLVNYVRLGSAEKKILRIVATSYGLFVFKADGVWRLTGANGAFSTDPIDPELVPLSDQTVCRYRNAAAVASTTGLFLVSDSGVSPIPTPFSLKLGMDFNPLAMGSSKKLGLLFVGVQRPTGDTTNPMYVYDGRRWATWVSSRLVAASPTGTFGSVADCGNELVFGSRESANSTIYEYECFNAYGNNFGDLPYTTASPTISSIDTGTNRITLDASLSGVSATTDSFGFNSFGGYDYVYKINSVVSGTVYELESVTGLAVSDTVRWLRAAECIVQPARVDADAPFAMKEFSNVSLQFGNKRFVEASFYTASDLENTVSSATSITGSASASTVGLYFPANLARSTTPLVSFQTTVAREHSMCSRLAPKFVCDEACGYFILDGMAFNYEPVGQEVNR